MYFHLGALKRLLGRHGEDLGAHLTPRHIISLNQTIRLNNQVYVFNRVVSYPSTNHSHLHHGLGYTDYICLRKPYKRCQRRFCAV